MNDLDNELFGSSDTDSDSDSLEKNHGQQDSNVEMSIETDPIFRSIMESCVDSDILESNSSKISSSHTPLHEPHPHIPGLCLHSHILSHDDQSRLMAQITEKNFFKAGQQNQAMCFGKRDLQWLEWLEKRLSQTGVLNEPYCRPEWTSRVPLFDQSIMNLYHPGDGIKPHVDLARFEDGIIIISLLSAISMDFYPALTPMSPDDPPEGICLKHNTYDGKQQQQRQPAYSVHLVPGSIITMQGPARYAWEHGIQEKTQDIVDGEQIKRKIRVSITLRKMRLSAWEIGPSSLQNGIADRK